MWPSAKGTKREIMVLQKQNQEKQNQAKEKNDIKKNTLLLSIFKNYTKWIQDFRNPKRRVWWHFNITEEWETNSEWQRMMLTSPFPTL